MRVPDPPGVMQKHAKYILTVSILYNHTIEDIIFTLPPCPGHNGLICIIYFSILKGVIPLLHDTGMILGLHPANDRRPYKVTPYLIGWAQT